MDKHNNDLTPEEEASQIETEEQISDPEEDVENAGDDKGSEIEVEELSEAERLRKKVAELEDKLLRTAAEFENYKKRVARQYEEISRSASDAVLLELLEVVDNFERALSHGDNGTDFESYRKGVELIFNQVKNLLAKYDVTPIEAVGQPFDPNLHEAMMQIESPEYDEGIVAIEMSRGYRQGNRVLRHSKVGVSTGEKDDENEK